MATSEIDIYNNDTMNDHLAGTGISDQIARPLYQLSTETDAYVQQVEAEMASLGEHGCLVRALAERELARMKAGEISEQGYFIVHRDVPIKVVRKVLIPIKEHPTVNFVGRLLGPKGATLKALQAATRTRIMIFGRGSMWDKNKEEESRNSGDPKYSHLNEDLHIYVEITAYPVEVQSRFTHVLLELKKFLDPNHPAYYSVAGVDGTAPPGMRGPVPPGYRVPRPYAPPRPVVPAVVSSAASAYATNGYYASPATVEPAYPGNAATTDTSNAYGYAAYPHQTDYSTASTGYETQAAQAQQYAAAQQQQYTAAAANSQPASYGAQPSYGQAAQPVYGQTAAQPAYGQTAVQPAYGQTAVQPAYGQTATQPVYGQGVATAGGYSSQPSYATSAYSAAVAPTAYGSAYSTPTARPSFSVPAAKKPRLTSPYGVPGSY